jgi:hypothetical protein
MTRSDPGYHHRYMYMLNKSRKRPSAMFAEYMHYFEEWEVLCKETPSKCRILRARSNPKRKSKKKPFVVGDSSIKLKGLPRMTCRDIMLDHFDIVKRLRQKKIHTSQRLQALTEWSLFDEGMNLNAKETSCFPFGNMRARHTARLRNQILGTMFGIWTNYKNTENKYPAMAR